MRCNVLISPIRSNPSHQSEMLSQMLYGETCEIIETEGDFAKIKMNFDEVEGWVNKNNLTEKSEETPRNLIEKPFGVFDLPEGRSLLSMGSEVEFPVEKLIDSENLRQSITDTAKTFLNVPFLWGGRSSFGVDAAGFVQLVFKIHNISLPRFANEQAKIGEVLDFLEESLPGDLAFFENQNGEIVHVGIVLDNFEIIHVNEKVRIDSLDSLGIFNSEKNKHTHKLRFVKRIIEEA